MMWINLIWTVLNISSVRKRNVNVGAWYLLPVHCPLELRCWKLHCCQSLGDQWLISTLKGQCRTAHCHCSPPPTRQRRHLSYKKKKIMVHTHTRTCTRARTHTRCKMSLQNLLQTSFLNKNQFWGFDHHNKYLCRITYPLQWPAMEKSRIRFLNCKFMFIMMASILKQIINFTGNEITFFFFIKSKTHRLEWKNVFTWQ